MRRAVIQAPSAWSSKVRSGGGTSQSSFRAAGPASIPSVVPGRGLAVIGHERADKMADLVGNVLEGTGDDESAVGVAEQHDPGEILVQHLVDDVTDVVLRLMTGLARWTARRCRSGSG